MKHRCHTLVGIAGDKLRNAVIGFRRAHDKFELILFGLPIKDGDRQSSTILWPDGPLPRACVSRGSDSVRLVGRHLLALIEARHNEQAAPGLEMRAPERRVLKTVIARMNMFGKMPALVLLGKSPAHPGGLSLPVRCEMQDRRRRHGRCDRFGKIAGPRNQGFGELMHLRPARKISEFSTHTRKSRMGGGCRKAVFRQGLPNRFLLLV